MTNQQFLDKMEKFFIDLYGEKGGKKAFSYLDLNKNLESDSSKEYKLYLIRENIHGILNFLEKYKNITNSELDKYIKNINDNLELYKEVYKDN